MTSPERAQAERDRQEAIYNRAIENQRVAEYAREYVVAQQEYEEDPYSAGWQGRVSRAHLARAALWGACGCVNACENDEPAVLGEQLPGITP